MNPKSVIIRTIFYFAFNVMNIVDIFVVWLLTIAYVIGTYLLDNVVMYAICYVKCVFTLRSTIHACMLMRVLDQGRLRVVRVMNLNKLTLG